MSILSETFSASEGILELRLKAIRASFNHGGMKGSAVEEEFRNLFRELLPDNIGVGTGLVIDSYGNRSKQLDIICYDKAKTPKFFSIGDASLFPVECVFFVFEVKTQVTPNELESCFKNMESVKNLKSTAYVESNSDIVETKSFWGKTFDSWQIIFGVLGLESNSSNSVKAKLLELRNSAKSIDKNIDSAYILGDGAYFNASLANQIETDASFLPTEGSFLVRQTKNPLMIFFALFSVYYNQAEIGPKFNFAKYVEFDGHIEVVGGATPEMVRKLQIADKSAPAK